MGVTRFFSRDSQNIIDLIGGDLVFLYSLAQWNFLNALKGKKIS